MSMEAVWEFRQRVNSDPALANEIKLALNGDGDLAAVAQRNGFVLTSDELVQGWALAQEGELSEVELELVSAGAPSGSTPTCN